MDDPRGMFETERLTLRRLDEGDVDDMHAVYGDAEAMRWVDKGEPLDREGCVGWVAVTLRNYRTRGYGMSAMILKETGEVIGFMGVVHPGGQEEPELKYALKRAFWGGGYATEAAAGMIAWAQSTLGHRRIVATTAPANKASHRVLEKAGMAFERSFIDESDGEEVWLFAWAAS